MYAWIVKYFLMAYSIVTMRTCRLYMTDKYCLISDNILWWHALFFCLLSFNKPKPVKHITFEPSFILTPCHRNNRTISKLSLGIDCNLSQAPASCLTSLYTPDHTVGYMLTLNLPVSGYHCTLVSPLRDTHSPFLRVDRSHRSL